ncbi:MAG: CBS domain-containing protein [Thermodesulfovibrionia bacterium]|nr:CBS domain-containing protein [Thermodesulfovibrionia bacterium]
MKLKEIMHGITMVDKGMSVLDVAKLMKKKNIGSVLTKRGSCVMMVTERDILKKVVAENKNIEDMKISDIMTKCTFTIDSDEDVEKASELFDKHDIRRLPITEGDDIVGIVTARDVAKTRSYVYAKKRLDYEKKTKTGAWR